MTWLGCALRVNNTRMRLVYRSTGAVQSGYRLTNHGLLVKQKVLDKCGFGGGLTLVHETIHQQEMMNWYVSRKWWADTSPGSSFKTRTSTRKKQKNTDQVWNIHWPVNVAFIKQHSFVFCEGQFCSSGNYYCDRKAEGQVRLSLTLWQQVTKHITRRDHSRHHH